MNERWRQLVERIDGLTARERILLFAALIAGVIGLWTWSFLDPVEARETQRRAAIENVQRQIDALHLQTGAIARQLGEDPDAELRQRREALQARHALVDEEITARGADLVPPTRMTGLLRDVLEAQDSLTLLRLESLPAERLGEGEVPVYRHGLVLEFHGDFMSTLRFLDALERLPWKFFWDEFDYRLEQHPHARVRLRLSTLSGQEGWIGV